jgi:hypothetical protein
MGIAAVAPLIPLGWISPKPVPNYVTITPGLKVLPLSGTEILKRQDMAAKAMQNIINAKLDDMRSGWETGLHKSIESLMLYGE